MNTDRKFQDWLKALKKGHEVYISDAEVFAVWEQNGCDAAYTLMALQHSGAVASRL